MGHVYGVCPTDCGLSTEICYELLYLLRVRFITYEVCQVEAASFTVSRPKSYNFVSKTDECLFIYSHFDNTSNALLSSSHHLHSSPIIPIDRTPK
jgi:hypothetical protein